MGGETEREREKALFSHRGCILYIYIGETEYIYRKTGDTCTACIIIEVAVLVWRTVNVRESGFGRVYF